MCSISVFFWNEYSNIDNDIWWIKHYRFKLSWCIILSLINYYNDNISSRELLLGN